MAVLHLESIASVARSLIRHANARRSVFAICWLLSPALCLAQPDGRVFEYLTRDQALLEVFPESATYLTETVAWSEDELIEAEKTLYRKFDESTFETILCYDKQGEFLGYAVISDEVGKYRPITYIVGIDTGFSVNKVAVMVYREDRGGEVRLPRFLYQYEGKSADDPIRTNRDIINISGATISVRSINAGVKKVLYLVTERYANDPPAATLPSLSTVPERAEQ